MTDEHSNIDYTLTTKYLAGEANAEERKQIEDWLKKSAANKHYFSQMEILWQQTGSPDTHLKADVNVDNAWVSFKNKTEAKTSEQRLPGRTLTLSYFARVAAVLIAGLVIYFTYQTFQKGSIEENSLITSNEIKADTLSDGSLVTLNVQSQLTFPEKFSGKKRQVRLRGQAFFEITPNTQKPFVIKTEKATIKVLGTSFYIEAYDSLNIVKVGVKEGSVHVTSKAGEVILKAGERIMISGDSTQMMTPKPYAPNDMYWKSQTLVFTNERLAEVFNTLEKTYDVTIDIENSQVLNCRLSAKFYKESPEHIFEIIDTNFGLTSKREGNHFIVSGDGCK